MKILVTGANGLLGTALMKVLHDWYDFVIPLTRKECDLSDQKQTIEYIKEINPQAIVHAGAHVGGVYQNTMHSEEMFATNLTINNNVFKAAHEAGVKQFVNILSTCLFPDDAIYPLTPDQMSNGWPHKSAFGYALSKRLSAATCLYYRKVYDLKWINVIPTNIYGPNDNFNLETGHVLANLLRKAMELKKDEDFVIWGDGRQFRQFIFSEDLAELIAWALWKYDSDVPLMCVNPAEYSIGTLAHIISNKFDIDPLRIKFDETKTKGISRMTAKTDFPNWKFTGLSEGIDQTIQWIKENPNKIRK